MNIDWVKHDAFHLIGAHKIGRYRLDFSKWGAVRADRRMGRTNVIAETKNGPWAVRLAIETARRRRGE